MAALLCHSSAQAMIGSLASDLALLVPLFSPSIHALRLGNARDPASAKSKHTQVVSRANINIYAGRSFTKHLSPAIAYR
ncbi:hypothetical protein C8F01DRAFT_1122998 [Mycena amicta]|nr:hypothetical protein C8F01DRAFT_1122998 [Mycena amicta]